MYYFITNDVDLIPLDKGKHVPTYFSLSKELHVVCLPPSDHSFNLDVLALTTQQIELQLVKT